MQNPRWRKAIRDFWQESTRTVLVVLAIAIGIAGFAAVLSTYAVLTRELNKGYLATDPASATLHTDAIDDALISAVLTDRDVSAAEARRALGARIKTGPAEWRYLEIFVVKDYGGIRLSKFVPEQGAWPPATGEMLIERDAFRVAHAKIGDTVTIRIGQGKEQTLHVSGRVHDVGLAQARMENCVYGYVTLQTLTLLGEKPDLDQLKILLAENRLDEQHIRSVAQDVKKLVEGRGHSVGDVDIPRPGKHPHADLMGLLLLAMSSFGFFVLILSGILVVNLLMGMMASQVRQIGVMKAIGGTRRQVAGIYFGQALLLGIAALAIALPVGIAGSRALCRSFAILLNFDITSFAIPVWVYLWVVAVGLLVPLLAAAWPVWKGSAISVREALADFGVSRNTFGSSVFDRMLAGIGGRSRPLLLGMRNSFRRRTRLALTLATLAVGGIFFMSAINIRASMVKTFDLWFASKQYDLTVGFGNAYPSDRIERAIRNTPGVARGEAWFISEGILAPHPGGGQYENNTLDGEHFSVHAVPSGTEMIKLEIVEGRDLLPGDSDAVVVNTILAAMAPEMKVGNTVSFRMGKEMTTWRVAGIAREFFPAPVAYVPQAFMDQRHPGMRNTAFLALDKDKDKPDPASMNQVKASLERNLQQEGVRIMGSNSQVDRRFSIDQHMLMIYVFLLVMSGIIVVVGGLGLATTMSLNVMERRREMGVIRAIGARPATIWLIIVTEGVVVGVLSWALAALAAWPVSKFVGDSLVRLIFHSHLDFLFQLQGLLVWLALSVLFSAVASFLPAWSASQITVREALAYE
ncbi:MAG: FtsX-like permease family protein [Acidobacteriia bacterium]|nr:FtsX-like permease family protein [Terriglobia bacterium]